MNAIMAQINVNNIDPIGRITDMIAPAYESMAIVGIMILGTALLVGVIYSGYRLFAFAMDYRGKLGLADNQGFDPDDPDADDNGQWERSLDFDDDDLVDDMETGESEKD